MLREQLPQLALPHPGGDQPDRSYRAATLRGACRPRRSRRPRGCELERPESLELPIHAEPGRPHPPADRPPPARVRGPAPGARQEERAGARARLPGRADGRRLQQLGRDSASCAAAGRPSSPASGERDCHLGRGVRAPPAAAGALPGPLHPAERRPLQRRAGAADLGLARRPGARLSLVIRRDHECAHYLTRRLFGSMRNNLLDELIADYAGLDRRPRPLPRRLVPALRGPGGLPAYRREPGSTSTAATRRSRTGRSGLQALAGAAAAGTSSASTPASAGAVRRGRKAPATALSSCSPWRRCASTRSPPREAPSVSPTASPSCAGGSEPSVAVGRRRAGFADPCPEA